MKKYIILLSVLINLAFVSKRIYFSSGVAEVHSNIPVNDSITTLVFNKYSGFDHKREMYSRLPISKTDVLFIGDSMTEQYPLNEIFSTLHIKNRGISGSASADVLKSVSGFEVPNTVFLMVGVNDFHYKFNFGKTVKNILSIIDTLRIKNKNTKIYVQSVLPVENLETTKQVMKLNSHISFLCKYNGATFINLFPRFVSNGKIKKQYTTDGIHLTSEGYKVWTNEIKKYIPTSAL